MVMIPELPEWAAAGGATPEGLAAYKRRRALRPNNGMNYQALADMGQPFIDPTSQGLPQQPFGVTWEDKFVTAPPGMQAGTPMEPPTDPNQTPPIWNQPGDPTTNRPPAPGGGPLGAFDFGSLKGSENAYKDPRFQQGWRDTMQALRGLDPEAQERARAMFKEISGAEGFRATEGRGMNAWREAINRARGLGGGTPPPGSPDADPNTMSRGVAADTSGITAMGGTRLSDRQIQAGLDGGTLPLADAVSMLDARRRPQFEGGPISEEDRRRSEANGMGGRRPASLAGMPSSGEQPIDRSRAEATYDEIIEQGGNPIFNPRASGGSFGKGGFQLHGPRQRRNPVLAPPREAMAEALGGAGMRRGGRPRPGINPRPTIPNEGGQMPAGRARPTRPVGRKVQRY